MDTMELHDRLKHWVLRARVSVALGCRLGHSITGLLRDATEVHSILQDAEGFMFKMSNGVGVC